MDIIQTLATCVLGYREARRIRRRWGAGGEIEESEEIDNEIDEIDENPARLKLVSLGKRYRL